jgi:hypothetical protein
MKVIHNSKKQQINFLDERFYFDGKDYWPSVTTILDVYPKGYGFIQWLKDVGNNSDEIVRRAGVQGTNVHDAIDRFLRAEELSWVDENEKAIYTLEEWEMILRFIDFWKTYKPEIVHHEFSCSSKKLQYGGTIDLVCRINKKLYLIDYKTSNALYPSYDLQIAAYVKLWDEENPKDKIDNFGLLWVKSATRGPDKTGKKIQGEKWILKEPERSSDELFKVFNHCHAIWKEEHPTYEPKNKTLPSKIHIDKL